MKKKTVYLLVLLFIMTASACSSTTESLDNAFREGYYYLAEQSDESQSCFYEFINGNLTIKIYDANGVVDASPDGTYIEKKDTIKLKSSDGIDETFEILADGSLKSSNDLLLEYRGSEEPKHMGKQETQTDFSKNVSPTVVPTEVMDSSANIAQAPAKNDETKVFKGKYVGGSMGFEYENYIMSFENDSSQISITSSKNPEIAFFVNDEEGIPTTNKELVGLIFNVYYKERDEIDSNTEKPVKVFDYISTEVVDTLQENEGKYAVVGLDDGTVESFIKSFRNYVKEDNKKQISELIEYPIRAYIGEKIITIRNKKAFIKKYDEVFNKELKSALVEASLEDMFANYTGIMFGSNDKNVWFSSCNDSEEPLLIVAINN